MLQEESIYNFTRYLKLKYKFFSYKKIYIPNKIINIILDVLKKYSEVNKIDLILDSNNYILSSNSINITDLIKNQVNKQIIEISFEKYQ